MLQIVVQDHHGVAGGLDDRPEVRLAALQPAVESLLPAGWLSPGLHDREDDAEHHPGDRADAGPRAAAGPRSRR